MCLMQEIGRQAQKAQHSKDLMEPLISGLEHQVRLLIPYLRTPTLSDKT